MGKLEVIKKRNLTEAQYCKFAREVGFKITYSRRIRKIASYYGVSEKELPQLVKELWLEEDGPIGLIREYLETASNQYTDTSIFGLLKLELGRTTEQSFRRYGDVNQITPALRKNYFATDGLPLDLQAQCIEVTYEKEIDPSDMADFMIQYPYGADTYKNDVELELEEIEGKFKHLMGFNLNNNFPYQFQKAFIQQATEKEITNCPF